MTFVKLNNVHQVFLSHQKRQFSTFQILRNGLRGFRKMKTKSEMELDKLKGNPNFYYVSNRFMFAPERLKNQPKPSKSSSDRNFKILFGVLFSVDLAVDLYCLKNNAKVWDKVKEKLEKIWPDLRWSEAWSEATFEVEKLSFNKETIAAVTITDAIFWAFLYLFFKDKNVQKFFTKMRKYGTSR